MEKKKNNGWFFKVLICLFVFYISLSIAVSSGYYSAKLNEKTLVTEENMKAFEEDVKNGKEVDIKDYINETHKDYSTKTSKIGVNISKVVEDFMTDGISKMIEIFKTLFT